MRLRHLIASMLGLGCSLGAWCADLALMPVSVHLDRQHDRATVQVFNNGADPVVLQADAIAWTREGGVDLDGPTDALVVNPPVFTLKPGDKQIVRVGLRRSDALQSEATYRMVLREVPAPFDADRLGVSGTVQVLMALRVPIYVAPPKVQRDERWQVQREADGHFVAQVTNTGNVHLKVARLRLHQGDGAALAENVSGSVLFPGESRSFALTARAPVSGNPLSLEVMTDRGAHDVAVDLAMR